MSRKCDPTKARRHWVYAREELCAMYSVSDGTITNWIRVGLEPIDSRRPQQFAGYKLRQFLTNMRWPGIEMDPDLPGYFKLSRRERAAESSMVKGTSLTFDQAICLFQAMPASIPIELRNRAIIALLIMTGIRVAALVTLRSKHICLDLGTGLLDAIREWARWRQAHGFGADASFFLPDRYVQPNRIGLGYRPAETEAPECWKSDAPIQRIIKDAARAACIPEESISSHDFRKVLHPFLSKQANMMIIEEIALQLNLGHTPDKTIRKHYASMQDDEREAILDELCRRALSHRSDVELYLTMERNKITEADPDRTPAKDIYARYSEG